MIIFVANIDKLAVYEIVLNVAENESSSSSEDYVTFSTWLLLAHF